MKMNTIAGIAMVCVASLSIGACGGEEKHVAPKADAPKTAANNQNTAKAPATQATEQSSAEDTQSKQPAASQASDTVTTQAGISQEMLAAKAALPTDAGKVRYEQTCKVCHDKGLLDAPKPSDKANWAPRIAKGMDVLYLHSIKGFNKMPAQANNDVSEAEVMAAVDYLVQRAS